MLWKKYDSSKNEDKMTLTNTNKHRLEDPNVIQSCYSL